MANSGSSSGGGASLDLGSGSGTDTLNGIVNYLQAGGQATTVISAGLLGVFVSPLVAFGDIVDGVANFFSTPFMEGGDAIGALFNALLEAPANLLETGANVSEDTLTVFLGDSLAGVLALPVAVGVTMMSLYLIMIYLNEPETGDTIPGLPFDVPDVGPLQLGVEEEDEGE